MNVIAIYHHPQECGSPYLTFISQETGQVVETVDISTGYYDLYPAYVKILITDN